MTDIPLSFADQLKAEGREEARTEFIKLLLQQGLTPGTLSGMGLGTPQQITQILNVHLHGRISTPEDEEIAVQGRKFVRQALAEAVQLLDIGPMAVKLPLILSALQPVKRMIGNDEGNSHDQAMAALEGMFAANRQIGE